MSRISAPSRAAYGYPRGGLHGQIVHAIGRRILSGAIRPGELLHADSHLRASRTVLREAIKVLAAKGLVESRPKTGTRVRAPESWNLLDPDVLAWQQEGTPQPVFLRKLTEVRSIVEPAAAELAAKRARAPELAALDAAFPEMKAALAPEAGGLRGLRPGRHRLPPRDPPGLRQRRARADERDGLLRPPRELPRHQPPARAGPRLLAAAPRDPGGHPGPRSAARGGGHAPPGAQHGPGDRSAAPQRRERV